MTIEEFSEKWNTFFVDDIEENDIDEYIEDYYSALEHNGFNETFKDVFSDTAQYNGSKFKVIRRLTKDECDVESMPMWKIQLENGFEFDAFPEEICKYY